MSHQAAISGLAPWPRLAVLVASAQARRAARTGVVYPLSEQALRASCVAAQLGLIVPVLYGPSEHIRALARASDLDLQGVSIVDTPDVPTECARRAVADCRAGQLQALMKGSLHTEELLGAVVARETGLRTARRISHAFVFDVPAYHKLLMLADAVVNIAPDLEAKHHIVQNAIDAAHRIGIACPKVAVLAAVESINAAIPATADAAALKRLAAEGRIIGGMVDGPFGFDNAISSEAAKIKGIQSAVAGDADILIAPDLNAGNILYKSLIYMARAECAGVVLGAAVPIILTSRADSESSRIASCAFASLLA
jgi:phosphate acetyltransferase